MRSSFPRKREDKEPLHHAPFVIADAVKQSRSR